MTNTPDKMKACPFCGNDASVSDGSNGLHFRVICNKSACRAAGPLERCAVDAKDAWNTRTPSRPADHVPDMVRPVSDDVVERVAKERADWLLDAIACATQDRRYLRDGPEYDEVAGEAILLNGEKAITTAIAALQAVPASGLTKREEHLARLEIRNALGPSSGSIFPEPPALKASGEE